MITRRATDIENAMKQAKANLAIEGLHVTGEEEALIRKKLQGELSHEEFLKHAAELAKKK